MTRARGVDPGEQLEELVQVVDDFHDREVVELVASGENRPATQPGQTGRRRRRGGRARPRSFSQGEDEYVEVFPAGT